MPIFNLQKPSTLLRKKSRADLSSNQSVSHPPLDLIGQQLPISERSGQTWPLPSRSSKHEANESTEAIAASEDDDDRASAPISPTFVSHSHISQTFVTDSPPPNWPLPAPTSPSKHWHPPSNTSPIKNWPLRSDSPQVPGSPTPTPRSSTAHSSSRSSRFATSTLNSIKSVISVSSPLFQAPQSPSTHSPRSSLPLPIPETPLPLEDDIGFQKLLHQCRHLAALFIGAFSQSKMISGVGVHGLSILMQSSLDAAGPLCIEFGRLVIEYRTDTNENYLPGVTNRESIMGMTFVDRFAFGEIGENTSVKGCCKAWSEVIQGFQEEFEGWLHRNPERASEGVKTCLAKMTKIARRIKELRKLEGGEVKKEVIDWERERKKQEEIRREVEEVGREFMRRNTGGFEQTGERNSDGLKKGTVSTGETNRKSDGSKKGLRLGKW
ncbi:hypothetical protein BZA77DRAFT_295945 [Pyronema omphalodes]|nr:hypothetical protein BZA77DRAFT_295945 [Pyronema omphalodes]